MCGFAVKSTSSKAFEYLTKRIIYHSLGSILHSVRMPVYIPWSTACRGTLLVRLIRREAECGRN